MIRFFEAQGKRVFDVKDEAGVVTGRQVRLIDDATRRIVIVDLETKEPLESITAKLDSAFVEFQRQLGK